MHYSNIKAYMGIRDQMVRIHQKQGLKELRSLQANHPQHPRQEGTLPGEHTPKTEKESG